MPSLRPRALAAPTLLLAAAVTLAGCATTAPGAGPVATSGATPDAVPAQSASPTVPAPTPTAGPAAVPACDNIIGEDTVSAFEGASLAVREEPFRIASTELDDGLYCVWADASLASDQAQIFGWAPISPRDAKAGRDELLDAGWVREQSDDGVYVTENPDFAMSTDADGYGITYLFGEGWVTVASTKQALLLIERPEG